MEQISAGHFNIWLNNFIESHKISKGMDVPCGDCRACCTSSYFIHIRPDETETLSLIPTDILFLAPGLPKGHVLMGYDENGHCPMFKNQTCSIYESRPQTCRDYDCRIFTATGISEMTDKPSVINQSNNWQFEFKDTNEENDYKGLRRIAHFLLNYQSQFPSDFVPSNPIQQAQLAIKIFCKFDYTVLSKNANIDDVVKQIVAAVEK